MQARVHATVRVKVAQVMSLLTVLVVLMVLVELAVVRHHPFNPVKVNLFQLKPRVSGLSRTEEMAGDSREETFPRFRTKSRCNNEIKPVVQYSRNWNFSPDQFFCAFNYRYADTG